MTPKDGTRWHDRAAARSLLSGARHHARRFTSERAIPAFSRAMDQTRATIIGVDPETGYSAEEARELAALFAGMRRLLEG